MECRVFCLENSESIVDNADLIHINDDVIVNETRGKSRKSRIIVWCHFLNENVTDGVLLQQCTRTVYGAKSSSDTACKQLSEVERNKNASKTHLRWRSQKTINRKQK